MKATKYILLIQCLLWVGSPKAQTHEQLTEESWFYFLRTNKNQRVAVEVCASLKFLSKKFFWKLSIEDCTKDPLKVMDLALTKFPEGLQKENALKLIRRVAIGKIANFHFGRVAQHVSEFKKEISAVQKLISFFDKKQLAPLIIQAYWPSPGETIPKDITTVLDIYLSPHTAVSPENRRRFLQRFELILQKELKNLVKRENKIAKKLDNLEHMGFQQTVQQMSSEEKGALSKRLPELNSIIESNLNKSLPPMRVAEETTLLIKNIRWVWKSNNPRELLSKIIKTRQALEKQLEAKSKLLQKLEKLAEARAAIDHYKDLHYKKWAKIWSKNVSGVKHALKSKFLKYPRITFPDLKVFLWASPSEGHHPYNYYPPYRFKEFDAIYYKLHHKIPELIATNGFHLNYTLFARSFINISEDSNQLLAYPQGSKKAHLYQYFPDKGWVKKWALPTNTSILYPPRLSWAKDRMVSYDASTNHFVAFHHDKKGSQFMVFDISNSKIKSKKYLKKKPFSNFIITKKGSELIFAQKGMKELKRLSFPELRIIKQDYAIGIQADYLQSSPDQRFITFRQYQEYSKVRGQYSPASLVLYSPYSKRKKKIVSHSIKKIKQWKLTHFNDLIAVHYGNRFEIYHTLTGKLLRRFGCVFREEKLDETSNMASFDISRMGHKFVMVENHHLCIWETKK